MDERYAHNPPIPSRYFFFLNLTDTSGGFVGETSRSTHEMPPSCVTMVPPGMDNGSLFPVMDLYALPSTLAPPVMAQADPERVQNMAAQLRHFEFVPINLADNIAEALIVGIQSALAIAGGRR